MLRIRFPCLFTCPCSRSQTSADDVFHFAGGLEEVDWRPLCFVGGLLDVDWPVGSVEVDWPVAGRLVEVDWPVASVTSRGELASPQGQCEPPVPPVVTKGGKQGATGWLPLHCWLPVATCWSKSHRSHPEFFKESAVWADSFYKSICPYVCLSVTLSHSV